MDRLVDTEKQLEEKTKKVSGTVRDSAQKLADGLNRVEKLANFERLERYVGLLERAAVAEFERSLLLERQAEGIALAKQEGKYKGRKPVLNADQAADLCCRVAAGESKAAVGRAMGIGRSSVYAYLAAGSPLTS